MLLVFSSVSVVADSLEEFIANLNEQKIASYWIYDNSVEKVSIQQATKIARIAYTESSNENVNPHLVLALMKTESSFNETAISNHGAKGLMQVIPRFHKDKLKGRSPTNSSVSIEVGTKILSDCLNKHSYNVLKGLNCYSGGGGAKYRDAVLKNQASLKNYVAQYYLRA